jgi:L-ascorbate metabolism protein UlaG (beta-lactamase superfamily)
MNMVLRWHGHSCFSLECDGKTLLIDPFDEGVGYELPEVKPDIILESHQHHDHNAHNRFESGYILVNQPVSEKVYGFIIKGHPTFHDDVEGKKRGKNIIFEVTTPDGFRVVHCGDLGHRLGPDLTETLKSPDILLVPVGGVYTIDAGLARELTRDLAPSYVVPMHFKTKDLTFQLAGVEDFLAGEPFEQCEKLELKEKANVGTRVVVLKYR